MTRKDKLSHVYLLAAISALIGVEFANVMLGNTIGIGLILYWVMMIAYRILTKK